MRTTPRNENKHVGISGESSRVDDFSPRCATHPRLKSNMSIVGRKRGGGRQEKRER